jgi:ATP/ADP translocase
VGSYSHVKPADEHTANSLHSFLQSFAPYLTTLWMIWSLLAIELTLFWNGITDVYDIKSTGQLIPFITGILSIAGLLQATITVYLRENFVSTHADLKKC